MLNKIIETNDNEKGKPFPLFHYPDLGLYRFPTKESLMEEIAFLIGIPKTEDEESAKPVREIPSSKTNWKTVSSHIRKHARHDKEMAAEASDILNEYARLENMFSLIHSEVDPQIAAARKADDYFTNGYRSLLEKCPEMYGVSKNVMAKYGNMMVPAEKAKGADCDCELEERDSRLVSIATHTQGDENAPLNMLN